MIVSVENIRERKVDEISVNDISHMAVGSIRDTSTGEHSKATVITTSDGKTYKGKFKFHEWVEYLYEEIDLIEVNKGVAVNKEKIDLIDIEQKIIIMSNGSKLYIHKNKLYLFK